MNGKDSVSEVKLGPKGKELLNQILQQVNPKKLLWKCQHNNSN